MRALVAWSGGKDAFLALGRALADPVVNVEGLLTTTTSGRVSMHGVPLHLVEAQARMLGLPLRTVDLPPDCVNEVYDRRVAKAMGQAKEEGITHVVHGDVRLEDVRAYREERLARLGLEGLFPLWGEDTGALAARFLDAGHQAVVCAVDGEALDAAFAGRAFDAAFLQDLPEGVDPCGEDGEFHTFVRHSPAFRAPIPCRVAGVSTDGRFHFADLVAGDPSDAPPRHGDLSDVPLFQRP